MGVNPPRERNELATRVFNKFSFGVIWVVLLGILLLRLWWVRDAALVWWVYGREAYFQGGVRVLPGKPITFSTGELAPLWPDLATGFGFFFLVVLVPTMLLILSLRAYERFRKTREPT